MANFINKLGSLFSFGYDAAESSNRRRSRSITLVSEDKTLPANKRRKLVSDARDLSRNYTLAGWCIRKHLTYTTTFEFQCRTGIDEFDDRIEQLINWWAKPLNCDVAGRHSLHSLIRMAENRAVTDGDVFILKLNTGMLQAIESHRICTPPNLIDDPSWVNGVKIDSFGRPTDYAVCGHDRKNPNDYTFIPAQFVFELGYFERFDQVRGVSPLAAALNQFSDLYECREYALAKAKIASILGLKLTREYVEENADEESADPLTINLANGPTVIELEPGQDADILESQTPSTQFVEYTKVVTADALKCLDIPYSFFDEAHTNYSGARQALLQYEQSAAIRRGIIERLLTNLTLWRLGLFIQDRTLQLPAGMTISDINFEWIGTALPWISPKDEALAEISLIDNAMDCRQDLCKKHGKDWFNIVDKLAQENKYLEANGVTTAAARAAMFQTPAPESPEEN